MSYDLDWNELDKVVNTERTRHAFSEVEHLFRKVAFDMYKPLNGSSLWELRDEADGKFLYALYEEPEDLTVKSEKEVKSSWNAVSDKDGKNVTLSFKEVPLIRFASDRYKFDPSEAELFVDYVQAKTQDSKFLAKLMKTLPENKRQVLAELNQKNRGV